MLPLIALPGTLLDERSLAAMLQGVPAHVEPLGRMSRLDAEIDRLAALPQEPAVWLGHSLGGIVVLHLARRHPKHVAGLVLLAANARAGVSAGAVRRSAQWTEAKRHGLRALARGKLGPGYGLAPDDPLVESLAAQAEATGLQCFEHQLTYASERPGLLSPKRTLAAPLLALSGEFDTLCPPAQSDEIASLSPVAQHLSLRGAGHLFPMQQPAWAALALRRFLTHIMESHS